jgi:death-on-curing protein
VSETVYLTIDDTLYMHDEQIRLFGGAPGVRDEGLVLSALLRPQTGYYRDLIEEAAALWESLAMNHGFVDGNKRVAFASLVVFLRANGFEPTAHPDAVIAFIYGHLEDGTFRKDILDEWLRQNTGPIASLP